MTWPLPTLFPEVLAGVMALDQAGRWQEALAAALDLYRHFPEEPRACAVLVDMLVALDRTDQAQVVLREARQRFPAETWISHRLAEQAAARQDWPAALAHWRDAGLPETADPAVLRRFAVALAHAGEADTALRLVTSPQSRLAGAPMLKLAELELLLQLGRTSDAAARWAELPTDWNEPGYADATCLLARLPEDDLAAPMLAALLAEPDPATEIWRPTVALALSADSIALSRRVQAALAQRPAEPGTTRDVAAALTETTSDTDALAARIARAVQDGRAPLLPLLFETAGLPARAASLRIALRLYLNRNFADPAMLDSLPPASGCALLLLARVIDPDCLRYIAEHVRRTTTRPGPLQLARPQDVLAQIAHTAEPPSPRIRVQRRLRVAICISGRLPPVSTGIGPARALRLQAHDATVFAHVWRQAGAPAPMAELDSVLRRLPPQLGSAFSEAADSAGLAGLRRLYPGLLQGRPGADLVDEAFVRALFHTDHVTVQDDRQGALAARSPLWKTRHAAREAHLLAAATGEAFDLCLHMQAGSALLAAAGIDWHGLAETAQNEAVMFADAGPALHRVHGFTVGHRFGLGGMTTMGLAADSFVLGEQLASGRVFVHGFRREAAAAHALAMQTHLNGITVRPLAELTLDATPELDPLSPAAALTLLWHDIRARRPAPPDKSLIRAAMADVQAPASPI